MAEWLIGAVAGCLSGLGVGGGTLVVIYLTMFVSLPQKEAQGANLLFYLAAALVCLAVWTVKKKIALKDWLTLAIPATIASLLASLLAKGMSNEWLRKGFALLLLWIGGKEFFLMWKERKNKKNKTNV